MQEKILPAVQWTLVQVETVSFRNYFDTFIAIKALHFEPTHISGIKSGLKFSGFLHFFITLPMNLETVLQSPSVSNIL